MAELDYYSVMQKRIEYFAKKYDPYGKFSAKEESFPAKPENQKPEKTHIKILSWVTPILTSLLRISLTS